MAIIDLLFRGMAGLVAQLYRFTSSYGLAIIGLTVVVRLILFPLTVKQVRSMQAMAAAQPEIKKLQELHKDDRQRLNTEMMAFYRTNGINPAAGCFPLLLQAPFLIALYNVIYGLTRVDELNWLMIRMPRPKYLDHTSDLYRSLVDSGGRMVSFGVDLAQSAAGFRGSLGDRLPYYVLVVLVAVTGIAQQLQMARRSPPTTDQAAQMQRIMKYLPILFAVFAYNVKAGVVLYWIAGNLWTMGQTSFLYRKSAPKPVITGIDGQPVVATAVTSSTASTSGGPGLLAGLKAARTPSAGGSSPKGAVSGSTPTPRPSKTVRPASGKRGAPPPAAGGKPSAPTGATPKPAATTLRPPATPPRPAARGKNAKKKG
jgi:YidC/Oxa1 family membrane protein insertase